MLEYFPAFLYNLLKDLLNARKLYGGKLSTNAILERRHRWRPLFEEEIRTNIEEKLREDVIIRDFRRIDEYPEFKYSGKFFGKRRISPWFRVYLIGTYHRGIMLGLSIEELVFDKHNEKWRRDAFEKGETEYITAFRVGYVPFERVEEVNWKGDEYYPYPHIFCRFNSRKGEPYERIAFCREVRDSLNRPRYIELSNVVRRN